VNLSALVMALVPPVVLTRTSTVPEPAGAVAVHELAVHTTPLAAVVPNATVPELRLEPLMVTEVPPATGPVRGQTALTVG
jgi:hypothetical protein